MENQDIIMENEVVEMAEEFTTASSGNGMKLFGGAVIAGALGFGIYKLVKKVKAKKEQQSAPVDCYDLDGECVDEVE